MGDKTEYSNEKAEHTYKHDWFYQVTLNVLNDAFDSRIESITAEPVTVNISSNIQNLLIETSLIKQEQEGALYHISSPAFSTDGSLKFKWKINNELVHEGENASSFQYTFPKYGTTYSISLEVTHIKTGEVKSASPVAVTTTLPSAKLYPPQSVMLNEEVQFNGEVKDMNTDQNFSSILKNPVYELEVLQGNSTDAHSKNNSLIFKKVFDTAGPRVIKLKVTAENLEAPIYSDPVTIYVNEFVVSCEFTSDDITGTENRFLVKATCDLKNEDSSYVYTVSYWENLLKEI